MKEYTREDTLRACYSKLCNLNQRLKNISECYYIAYDGSLFMRSLIPFMDVFAKLHDPESIQPFQGGMILPNAFFNFSKKAKKKQLTFDESTDATIAFGQENDDLSYKLNLVNQDPNADKQFIDDRIIPKMYKRFFELHTEKYTPMKNAPKVDLSEEDVDKLIAASALYVNYEDDELVITKNLLLDLKKGDSVTIEKYCTQIIDDKNMRVIYMLTHTTDIYTSFSIFGLLKKWAAT